MEKSKERQELEEVVKKIKEIHKPKISQDIVDAVKSKILEEEKEIDIDQVARPATENEATL